MAFKVFVDTNIFVDILLKREPFVEKSQWTVSDIVNKTPEEYLASI
jgi:predicted nucleic acid-binding protein